MHVLLMITSSNFSAPADSRQVAYMARIQGKWSRIPLLFGLGHGESLLFATAPHALPSQGTRSRILTQRRRSRAGFFCRMTHAGFVERIMHYMAYSGPQRRVPTPDVGGKC